MTPFIRQLVGLFQTVRTPTVDLVASYRASLHFAGWTSPSQLKFVPTSSNNPSQLMSILQIFNNLLIDVINSRWMCLYSFPSKSTANRTGIAIKHTGLLISKCWFVLIFVWLVPVWFTVDRYLPPAHLKVFNLFEIELGLFIILFSSVVGLRFLFLCGHLSYLSLRKLKARNTCINMFVNCFGILENWDIELKFALKYPAFSLTFVGLPKRIPIVKNCLYITFCLTRKVSCFYLPVFCGNPKTKRIRLRL